MSREHYSVDLLKQSIKFEAVLGGRQMRLQSTWGLFSPRQIDEGTVLLLKHLEVSAGATCLDIGCGYGPIGLAMAAQVNSGEVWMVDKDFVAVEFSNKNAQENQLINAKAILSNGLSHLPQDVKFDLVASNVPAKIGKELMSIMLNDAFHAMNPGGAIYLVTINGLREYMKRNLQAVFGNYKKLKQGKNYTVHFAEKIS